MLVLSFAHPDSLSLLISFQAWLVVQIKVVIVGDFNIHMDSEGDPLRSALLSIIESIGFDQHIHQSTHFHNHTLDLVSTHNTEIVNIVVMPKNPVLSDHYLITFQLSQVCHVSPDPTFYFSRKLSSTTSDAFINELPGSFVHCGDFLGSSQNAYTNASIYLIDQLTNNLNDVLCRTLDTIAPLKKRKVCSKKLAPWYNDNTHALKKASCQLERKLRSTKLQVFFHAWKDSLLSYKHAISTTCSSYFSTLRDENRNNPRHLFNTVARLTKNHVDPCVSIPFSSNDFMNFFDDKIIKIRDTIQSSSTPHVGSTLPSTQMDAESSEGQVAQLKYFASIDFIDFIIIVNSSKSSPCLLEPITTKLLKELLPVIGTPLLNIVNASLVSGHTTETWSHQTPY